MIRQNQGFLTKLYMLTDFVFIQLAFLLAWWMKFESGWFPYENRAHRILRNVELDLRRGCRGCRHHDYLVLAEAEKALC